MTEAQSLVIAGGAIAIAAWIAWNLLVVFPRAVKAHAAAERERWNRMADVALERIGPLGHVTPAGGTLYGCEMPFRGESWVWDLVPAGPGRRGERLRVVGVVDIRT